MKRQIGPMLLLATILTLFGGFAWFTQHPESPWLEKAQEWPVVGELARSFRRAYLGPEAVGEVAETAAPGGEADAETAEGAASSGRRVVVEAPKEPLRIPSFTPPVKTPPSPPPPPEPEVRVDPPLAPLPPRPVVRRPSPPEPKIRYMALEWAWFLPGKTLRPKAASGAESVAELEAMAHLPVLARDGVWVEVVYQDRRLWLDTTQKPPHPRKGARRGILRHRAEPIRGNDAVKLRKARKILGIERPSVKLGAYKLYTDVDDPELLAFLDAAAEAAEEAYFARYGRLPSGDPSRSVVLFAKESSYRLYSEEAANLPGDPGWSAGHAGQGVLAFFAEDRTRETLARTLVHEIAHLLNDRALAQRLPPWLEEGIAGDLGSVWVEDTPEVARQGGRDLGWNLTIQGPESRLLSLEPYLDSGKLPPIVMLLNLDREKFYQGELRSWAYAHSFAFIRFLLDADGGRHAPGFLEFLRRIAVGFDANLLKQLELEAEELETAFLEWLDAEIERSRERIEERFSKRIGP